MTSTSSFSSQYRSVSDDYRMSRVHLASQVHKAIRDGDYEWLPDLVTTPTHSASGFSSSTGAGGRGGADILWEANSSGWTALHYAASHFLPLEWWRWILERSVDDGGNHNIDNNNMDRHNVPEYHHRFQTVRNDLGETVLDIFFRSFLSPLPWQATQVKNCSKRLLEAIECVCQDPTLLQSTRDRLDSSFASAVTGNRTVLHDSPSSFLSLQEFNFCDFPSSNVISKSRSNNRNGSNGSNSVAVLRCVCFCRNLQLLCELAQTGRISSSSGGCSHNSDQYYGFGNVIPFLAETGGCPEPFARLALALYPERARSPVQIVMTQVDDSTLTMTTCHLHCATNIDGRTSTTTEDDSTTTASYPLHLWSASRDSCCKVMNGIQKALLRTFPEAARTVDSTGRYPLHHALASGNKQWQDVIALFEEAPFVLECRDPVTGLFPVALLALNHRPQQQQKKVAPIPLATSVATQTTRHNSNDHATAQQQQQQHSRNNGNANYDDDKAIEIRARQRSAGDKGLVSLWYIMPLASRKEAIERAAQELDCERLTSIYLALKAFPRVLPSTLSR